MDTESKISSSDLQSQSRAQQIPGGPLFDALARLSEGGYLVRIHQTTAPRRRRGNRRPGGRKSMTWWWPPAETAPSTR